MDFNTRNAQEQPATAARVAPVATTNVKRVAVSRSDKLARIVTAVSALLVAILLVFVALTVSSTNNNEQEGLVDNSKLQAVFLNTGQVYFGKITTLNNKFFVVKNIYYLQTSSTGAATAAASNTSVSLVKLGCELHEPYDKMVINASQVTFWENLQDNGQVATAVAKFVKQNPKGQKCTDQTANSTSTGTSVQNAGAANTGATNTTNSNTTTTPKP